MSVKIRQTTRTIREISSGYENHDEDNDIVAMDGKLNIRPKYQRDYFVDHEWKQELVRSVMAGLPINPMYWADKGNGEFEVMDGQQRLISILEFIKGNFFLSERRRKHQSFAGLPPDVQKKILDYEVLVCECRGTPGEILSWFRKINNGQHQALPQEMRNAAHTGEWLTAAKKYFSKRNSPGEAASKKYMNGKKVARQEVLEEAIAWVAGGHAHIDEYMEKHMQDADASHLIGRFEQIVEWIERVFPRYRSEMRQAMKDWPFLAMEYADWEGDVKEMDHRIDLLLTLPEVQSRKGVFRYALTGEEACLNLRGFQRHTKELALAKQRNTCAHCGDSIDIDTAHADHKQRWSDGGDTTMENCQMLCVDCHSRKTANENRNQHA